MKYNIEYDYVIEENILNPQLEINNVNVIFADVGGGAKHHEKMMWDGTDGRRTVPVRDAAQKSYMPRDQWEEDTYPAFASGCGFLLSRGLVDELVRRSPSFSFFRLIDVPVGICLAQLPADSFRLVHIPEVRAYRPLPLYRSDTLVQHYMQPEEFHQYHQRALADAAGAGDAADGDAADAESESERRAAEVYDLLRAARCMR